MKSRPCLVAASLLGLVLADTTPALATTAAPTRTVAGAVVARYGFDGRSAAVRDESGHGHTMRLIARGGGKLRPVSHGAGRAMQFPPRCAALVKCPHVVLQSSTSPKLNPGRRPLAFGATVRLSPAQTSTGQNVVQKGYSRRLSQYKLQVDGFPGRPSCVVVDVANRRIRIARSAASVADNRWHEVSCRRDASTLTIIVDGVIRGSARVPAGLSVSNRDPLSIGGKGAYTDNDQFQGAVDDVWVRIGG